MDSKIGFEMNLIVVEAIHGRCASFTVLTATVSEIFGGQTTPSIFSSRYRCAFGVLQEFVQIYNTLQRITRIGGVECLVMLQLPPLFTSILTKNTR